MLEAMDYLGLVSAIRTDIFERWCDQPENATAIRAEMDVLKNFEKMVRRLASG